MKVTDISLKMQVRRLKLYGHVMRRDENCIGRKVMAMDASGPKYRWNDN